MTPASRRPHCRVPAAGQRRSASRRLPVAAAPADGRPAGWVGEGAAIQKAPLDWEEAAAPPRCSPHSISSPLSEAEASVAGRLNRRRSRMRGHLPQQLRVWLLGKSGPRCGAHLTSSFPAAGVTHELAALEHRAVTRSSAPPSGKLAGSPERGHLGMLRPGLRSEPSRAPSTLPALLPA